MEASQFVLNDDDRKLYASFKYSQDDDEISKGLDIRGNEVEIHNIERKKGFESLISMTLTIIHLSE